MMGRSRRYSWLATLLLPLAACQTGSGDTGARIGADEPKQTQLPRVEVKLPPPPSFKKDHAPPTYPDQTLSVFGLRKDLESNLRLQVRVTAHIIEVYQCPPCPKGVQCKPCSEPHFWIADRAEANRDKALMVVDLPPKGSKKKLKLDVGARHIFSGTFSKSSPAGFKAADGLLVYESHAPAGS